MQIQILVVYLYRFNNQKQNIMTTLTHRTFGTGTVISEENGNITIDFNGTVKTMITAFAKLTNEDGSPYGVAFVAKSKSAKKLNKANFMSEEEKANNKYSKMSKDDFNDMREAAKWGSKSF